LEVVETEGPADKEAMDAVVDKIVDVEAVGLDEAVDLEAVETVGQEAAEGAVDKVLGLQAAKSAFLYQAQNLQQSFGHCLSEYFEYFDYFPCCSADCSASSGTFGGSISHPQDKNFSNFRFLSVLIVLSLYFFQDFLSFTRESILGIDR
jgi:hypothetical protein